jgi:hypothetical protein
MCIRNGPTKKVLEESKHLPAAALLPQYGRNSNSVYKFSKDHIVINGWALISEIDLGDRQKWERSNQYGFKTKWSCLESKK